MNFYKITENQNIIDVNTSEDITYVCYNERLKTFVACSRDYNPIGIVSSDGDSIYHISGADSMPNDVVLKVKGTDIDVYITEISEEDYEVFKKVLDEQKEVIDPDPYIPEPEPEPEKSDEEKAAEDEYRRSLQFVKDTKIAYMSRVCQSVIENGITVILTDGEAYHFALTKEDQINLMECKEELALGAEYVSYHADGGLCTYYSAEDMMRIISAGIYHKKYQITYFNSLKNYINSMDNMVDISEAFYGMAIPEEYQSEPLKDIWSQS